jgi:hypothetical protein
MKRKFSKTYVKNLSKLCESGSICRDIGTILKFNLAPVFLSKNLRSISSKNSAYQARHLAGFSFECLKSNFQETNRASEFFFQGNFRTKVRVTSCQGLVLSTKILRSENFQNDFKPPIFVRKVRKIF